MSDQQTATQAPECPVWAQPLQDRGILGAALECGVQPHNEGWRYPILKSNGDHYTARPGVEVFRWKAFDSNATPKYLFDPGDPQDGKPWEKPQFYFAPGFKLALERADYTVIWSSGEPDTWAWIQIGIRNVFNWFGEKNVPPSLVNMLQTFGVKRVLMYPDLDPTGQIAAAKVHRILREANIDHEIYMLPWEILGEGGDINKLWVASEFDRDLFEAHRATCKRIDLGQTDEGSTEIKSPEDCWRAADSMETFWALVICPENGQEPAETTKPATNTHEKQSEWSDSEYRAFIRQAWEWIETDCGISGYRGVRSNRFACKFAAHTEDQVRPAAYLYKTDDELSGSYCCPKCGISLNIKDYLQRRGKDPVEFYPIIQGTRKPPHKGNTPKQAETSWLVGWDEAGLQYQKTLNGELSVITAPPLPIPFEGMRRHGGLARNLDAGLVMGIISGSGWGKTVLSETLIDYWRKNGFNGCIWGPEWSPEKYFARSVFRAGGPAPSRITEHKAWHADRLRGIPENKRAGQPLSEYELKLAREKREEVLAWPGTLITVDKPTATARNLFGYHDHDGNWHNGKFDEVAIGLAAQGKRLGFAVLDYANLVAGENGNDKFETVEKAVTGFKMFCSRQQVAGVEVFQIDKVTSNRVLAGNAEISLESMLGARSWTLNLCVGLWRDVDPESGDYTSIGHLKITKNSEGHLGTCDLTFVSSRGIWSDIAEDPTP